MVRVVVNVPAEVATELMQLGAAVDAVIPAKRADNLLVGSWNLRAFSGLSPTWAATSATKPQRDWRAVASIAQILAHFDVVAVQEVRRNVSALRFLMTMLGAHWRVLTSDVTEGNKGNGERLTFLYDTTRVQPSGLVGEIVLPAAVRVRTALQFARSPYAASFTRDGVEFILTTVHIVWASASERIPEIRAFAEWMRAWADRKNDWNTNLLVLGDFNIDRYGNPLYDAFIETGLFPPPELNKLPRTIFDDETAPHFYDQIAWFTTNTNPVQSLLRGMTYTGRGGSFNFPLHVYPGLERETLSWRISDHYPLWVEFALAS
ncbi:endonuclease/exonuclease/phosphatase family protein [Cryobacterium sp. CG_9.6]|uniref:endonuclease/exonuclease/phosphatase family protein n=1 Tax=Cryobacterium sp. CG_9.6 TaxID=2760710 RepID=UPI002475F850|nr:endonuclease/exonuclease/phosphatase family protein [Cryobacterium sp. CG_9.6]MDH6235261.1 endonuclease/exonuclease/phosphatase family metal-dependent hydrolase [Cryobacterium sp. CG_9.6]